MGKGGSVSVDGGVEMSEDALVNTGAAEWPHPDSAYFAVRRMQAKSHRWAGEDPSRRLGDLFNLVYDPAFLVHARERVSTNKGAQTAGIGQATTAGVEAQAGVGSSWAALAEGHMTGTRPGSRRSAGLDAIRPRLPIVQKSFSYRPHPAR
jgi:hypothetical protein